MTSSTKPDFVYYVLILKAAVLALCLHTFLLSRNRNYYLLDYKRSNVTNQKKSVKEQLKAMVELLLDE